jgi:hypothetical protein
MSDSPSKMVADEILRHLGGGRFMAMTGAKNLLSGTGKQDRGYLIMTLASSLTKGKANRVKITLMPDDTYKVEAIRVVNFEPKTLAARENVFCDNLRAIFTDLTGLRVSL